MRRITVVWAVVGLFMTATVALGANVARMVTGKHQPSTHQIRKSEKSASARKRAKGSGSKSKKVSAKKSKKPAPQTLVAASMASLQPMPASATLQPTPASATLQPTPASITATAAGVSTTLLGDSTVEGLVDSNDAGQPEAFPFTAQRSGQAQTIAVYLDSRNKATSLLAGLYSNRKGQPGSLLAAGTLSSLQTGAWNTVSIIPTTVTSGTMYWVTLMGRGGSLYFRDRSNGPCSSQSATSSGMSVLPTSWAGGNTWPTCPVSAYVNGSTASSGASGTGTTTTTSTGTTSDPPPPLPVPPLNLLPPQISGTTTDGQGLSTSNGTWTEADSYAYQWERCDTTGANCSNVSGATNGSYTLSGADIGHTIRVVVTASSAGGSAAAQSSQTATVAPPPTPTSAAVPQVSGTAQQGSALTTTNGGWTGSPSGYSYKWEDCNTSGASCTAISGATSSSYTLTAGDVGNTIRAIVTAANDGGAASATSAQTAAVSASTPAAPTSTAAPQVSGTAKQSSTLTTTNGGWTGSPTSYSYEWEDCNTSGASCTAISGAASSSYTLAVGDVGNTIRSIVTATNAGGSVAGTSPATAVIASAGGGGGGGTAGLPTGVSLQAIDGGQNYFGKWSNGFPTSPSYFPIGVFDQSLGYTSSGQFDQSQINAYKNEGINTFVNLYDGYNSSLINALHSAGMYVLDGPTAPSYANATLAGFVWFDEADGMNDCGNVPSASMLGETVPCSATSSGRTPASAIAQVNADLQGAHGAGDATRPDYCQYTKPVAENSGLSTSEASAYVNAGCSIVSYDSYIINDSYATPNNNLWRQYDDVQNVRSMANNKLPVWPFIEAGEPFTSNQWSGIKATPAMEVAEAWNAIIGGARGLQWFDHDFGGSSGGYAESGDDLIDSNSVFAGLQAAVKAFDNEVTALAPVLNSSFANGYVTNNGQMNVMAKYNAADNHFYIFAAPRSNSAQTITFHVGGGYSGPVQVYNEGRSVTASGGAFTDTFSGQTDVHVYVVPNTA